VDKATALTVVQDSIKAMRNGFGSLGIGLLEGFPGIEAIVNSTYNKVVSSPCATIAQCRQSRPSMASSFANIKTSGATFDVKYDTKQCAEATSKQALDAASNQMMLALQ
jgi:hypothetical protein